ncbi:uncharacterized protein ASCRUDRAFT_72194 [Ascoidea rubescens DSM 1968]|uniref:Uncharacterized protein n=1 Tax=Ascoidea rubescens DSM 1968 TaxID=1344418 RepID=A0A1D2VB02_9ASCO|nr:hypothetical protein ASCRUDRAFT_72194 [Ascoidea rubescens DSM 1968]ODV58779.1 hypothetical protein ASCRUDRAFT_72194 [Ascoidea rubescens DSM 1968]
MAAFRIEDKEQNNYTENRECSGSTVERCAKRAAGSRIRCQALTVSRCSGEAPRSVAVIVFRVEPPGAGGSSRKQQQKDKPEARREKRSVGRVKGVVRGEAGRSGGAGGAGGGAGRREDAGRCGRRIMAASVLRPANAGAPSGC